MFSRKIIPALLAGGLLISAVGVANADTETTTVRTTTVTSTPLVLPSGATYVVVDPSTGITKGVFDPVRKTYDYALSPGLVVIDNSSNKVVATFDASGNVISLTDAPLFDPLLVSIDSRRAEFDRIIRDIKLKGGYDDATIASLVDALNSINAQEVAYRASGNTLTYAEELSLAVQLNSLADRVMPFSRNVTITPLIGDRFVSNDGTIVLVDSFAGRNLQMQRHIDAEYSAGRLSNNQVARLKQELNEVSTLQARYTRGGVVKDSKQKILTEKLDRVQTDMDKNIATINEKRAKIGIKVN